MYLLDEKFVDKAFDDFEQIVSKVEGHVRKGSDPLTLRRVRTGRELYDIGYRLDVDRS